MTDRYNIVVIGKTGAGKSSLINYLYGKNIRKTGVGKPVNRKGFESQFFNIRDLPVCIYDSWGLGAGLSGEWMEMLNEELAKRTPDKRPAEWFHTIFYCIGAGGSRVEEFELDVIKRLIDEKHIVSVVLTKADQATKEELNKLQKIVHSHYPNNSIEVIPACAEKKKVLRGHKTEPFGRRDLLIQAYSDFWNCVCLRLPDRCDALINHELDLWIKAQRDHILKNMGAYNIGRIHEDLEKAATQFIRELETSTISGIVDREIRESLQMYLKFTDGLNESDTDMPAFNLNLPFPEIEKGTQQMLGALSGLLFPSLLLGGWWGLRNMGRTNALKSLALFEAKLHEEMRKARPLIKKRIDDIRKAVVVQKSGKIPAWLDGILSSYDRIRKAVSNTG